MGSAFVYAAARTPFGRFGGALAGVRPDDLAATALRGALAKVPGAGSGRDRRRRLGQRQRRGRGQPQRRPDGRAAGRAAGQRARHHGQPAVRVQPRRGHDGVADRSRPATPTWCVAGGVESMTRAPWVLPKPVAGLPGRRRDRGLDHARLAAGQPEDAGGVDRLARRGATSSCRRSSPSPASGRTPSPPARTSWPTRPGTTGFYDDLVVAGRGRGPGPRRGHPARHHAGEARRARSRRSGPTAPSPPATPRRSTTAPRPCCSARRGGRGRIGVDPLARIAGRGAAALEPQMFGYAPVEAADAGAAPGRHRLGRRRARSS